MYTVFIQDLSKGDFNLHMDKHRGIRYRCTHPGCKKDSGSEKAKNQHMCMFLEKGRFVMDSNVDICGKTKRLLAIPVLH